MEEIKSGSGFHPVQLVRIAVKELSVLSHIPPDAGIALEPNEKWQPETSSGYGDPDENNTVQVFVSWELGSKDPNCGFPAYIKAEIVGFFKIMDTEKFDPKDLSKFAQCNAPFLLLPYLRVEVFNLSARAGFQPLLLPLSSVPVFKPEDKKLAMPKSMPVADQ